MSLLCTLCELFFNISKFMNKNDFILILCVLALCAGLFAFWHFSEKSGDIVTIMVNGELYQTAELYTDAEISVNGTNTVVIHDGEVYMESADCPDQLCVKQGKIHDAGRDIVCLPNRVVVSVSKESTVDAISE